MRARRAVLLTSSFPADLDDPSGHFVRADARRLIADGYQVDVVAAGGHVGAAPIDVGPGVTVHWAGGGQLFRWPGAAARLQQHWETGVGAWEAHWGFRTRLDRMDVDELALIRAHWLVPVAYPFMPPRSTPARVEAVAHGADVRLLLALPRSVRNYVIGRLLSVVEQFQFVSGSSRDALLQALPLVLAQQLSSRSRVEPIELGAIGVFGIRRIGGQLIIVGRLVRDKCVDIAISAVAAAGPWSLLIVGDGPDRPRLQALVRDRGLNSRVRFAGLLPHASALRHIAESAALLHPSEKEAAPTVVREARGLGVAVIATDAGDITRWAETDSGIWVVERSAAAFANAIHQLSEASPAPVGP